MNSSIPNLSFKQISTWGYFNLKSWHFWRVVLICFCVCCLIGHAMEYPYCLIVDATTGYVADDYNVFLDPWFVPYWVYGFGALAMTFILEPLKERFMRRRKTYAGAFFESFVSAVVIAAVLEVAFGLLINQPNEMGVYPYWDNSQLPGNILQQGWIVNDLAIGLVAMVYIWVIYPVTCWLLWRVGWRRANLIFAGVVLFFIGCCIATIIYMSATLP